MVTGKKNLALLPNGFVDLLPPVAEHEYRAAGKMMMIFASFGYQRVKPPMLEFEESLFAPGPGESMIDDTFRVMDPVSRRMMGVRSDITPQIARIACSRLGKEPRPLRLCYANDVLRTKAGQQRTERQFCQVGCEIVGDTGIETDIESCVVALVGLKEIGVENITIDLSFPCIVGELLDRHKVDEDDRAKIKKVLESRAVDRLKGHNKKLVDALSKLAKAAGPGEKALKALAALGDFKPDIRKLETIHNGIARALNELEFDDVKITIDSIETRGFKYHSGLGFTIFAAGVSGEIGRGGRYDIHFGGQDPVESACGFTLYMDTVRKAMPPAPKRKTVAVNAAEDWSAIRAEQRNGTIVIRGKAKEGKKK
ncbi:MAG: ATP phosphoribosyltransferase regulatory subunit [Alphaproteobacteria bacterium]